MKTVHHLEQVQQIVVAILNLVVEGQNFVALVLSFVDVLAHFDL